jgi:type II secretory pathway pseudopilin PulG
MTNWLHAAGRRLRGEDGFGLIEALVSALVVAIVSSAVLTGLEAADSASGRAKARATATTLAQNDQERLRILDMDTLSNLNQTNVKQQCDDAGKSCVSYTVASTTQWVSDGSGTATCTGTDKQVSYLKLKSVVTWPNMRGGKPAVSESVLAPPAGSFSSSQGSLAIQIVGADGVKPVPNVRVDLAGPDAQSGVTNASGCVLWGYLTAGSGYTVTLNEPGYVSPQGKQLVTQPVSVIAEAITTSQYLYDKSASADVSFVSTVNVSPGVPKVYTGQKVDRITVTQSSMGSPARFGVSGTPAALISTGQIFPFSGSTRARVFAGDCDGKDPYLQSPAEVNANLPYLPDLTPGGQNTAATVPLPPFDVKVTVAGAPVTAADAANIKIVSTTAGCTNPAWGAVARQPVSTTLPDVGRPTAPGYPYGTYTVCADATIAGTTYREAYTGVALKALAGSTVNGTGVIDITTADEKADCDATVP